MTDKEKKLLDRPVEPDTKILKTIMIDFGEFKGLYEKWIWDGISASSVICLAEDLQAKSKDEILELLFSKMQLPVDPQTTYQISGEYVFLNFGFNIIN